VTRQSPAGADLPLRRISLLSSGVAYFEHSGHINPSSGQTEILLSFDVEAVNDVLKSLVVNDPASTSASVRYASQDTLERTLKSLRIDLSGTPGVGEILNSQKGADLEITLGPNAVRGRIIGVEFRQEYAPVRPAEEAWLSLFTSQGIQVMAVKDISSFRFTDESINADLNRALNLIMASRDENTRNLLLTLNGSGSRLVSLSYVIPAPVWKVSYRLDLSGSAPLLQGWAIVDNDSDTDWNNVELSLVTGRPVSFIQNLYPPYRLSRPVLPLSIAGIAESKTYESGYDSRGRAAELYSVMADERLERAAPAPAAASASAMVAAGYGGNVSPAAAGDQFLFTVKNPVTLERRQSAMLPLVESVLQAERTLVFSGARASSGASIHPAIGAELTNTSGMKLPAGPVTVYDGGTYAGDALIDFFPDNEKRLISYGDDLSVSGNMGASASRYITTVTVSGGVMTVSRRQSYEKVYAIRNASGEAKKIIIEHPVTSGAELVEPKNADERTANLYRFSRNLAARETLSFTVREEIPLSERVTLAQLRSDAFLSYASNQEIPANVREALNRAIELKRKADEADAARAQLESQKARLFSEQDRIRLNLEAAGNQSPQGQEYLRRLTALDSDIDTLNARIDSAATETDRARKEYEDYLAAIRI
jgi:hypothetical protein